MPYNGHMLTTVVTPVLRVAVAWLVREWWSGLLNLGLVWPEPLVRTREQQMLK